MSQASKFRTSNLILSAVLLLVGSGQAMAQQPGADDKPQMAFAPAQPAAEAAVAPEAPKAAAPKRKVVAPKAQRKVVADKEEAAAKPAKPAEELKFAAPLPGEVTVSDRDLNRFVFGTPITNLVFPPNAPVVGKPTYLANNTQVLVQLRRGEDKPVQMLVELDNERVVTLYLKPRPGNGVVYRHEGARDTGTAGAASRAAAGGDPAPRGEDIELLKRVVGGDVPGEFEPIALPRPTRFDKFTVVPLAGWSDGNRRVLSSSLVAVPGKTAVVASPQFYRQGITAVMLTGDHVDESTNPQLYVVEEVTRDE